MELSSQQVENNAMRTPGLGLLCKDFMKIKPMVLLMLSGKAIWVTKSDSSIAKDNCSDVAKLTLI